MHRLWHQTFLPLFSLFSSVSTLLCCALPALLVTLGAGATLAGLVSNAPWLITLSEHKPWVFGIAGLLLLLTGALRFKNRNAPCPIDPISAQICSRIRKISSWIYWISLAIYATGFFFAFIAVRL